MKKFCLQTIFCIVYGSNVWVWRFFGIQNRQGKGILAVSFLLLFGEPCFLRNKLPDKNVLKNHGLSAAEVFVKESWQRMRLLCNFSTSFVSRRASYLIFMQYSETSSAYILHVLLQQFFYIYGEDKRMTESIVPPLCRKADRIPAYGPWACCPSC